MDQFLESLLNAGIDKIIRVGGQSKSEELEGKNLQTVSRTMAKTRSEKASMYLHHETLESIQQNAEKLCKEISRRPDSWLAVKEVLQRMFPSLYVQFDSGLDPDGYQEVSSPDEVWDAWRGDRKGLAWELRNLNINDETHRSRPIDEISECDIWSFSKVERAQLVKFLSERAAASPTARLAFLTQGQAVEISELNAQYHEINRRCLDQADVIGITTTGLAKQCALLGRVGAKVVICEEAGEVLEAHLINAILPTCQHLIQIGDHEQLRPQINTYNLSLESRAGKNFRLDESMFERLVRENTALSPAQLSIQRRMRPVISTLIRNTLYPGLQDHPSTTEYPDVVGMRNNIFWLDHTYPEAGVDDSQTRSHSNNWEVQMTHGLVRHLVRQGHYDSKDIAVLTPYTGQLQKLREELKASFEVILSEKDEEALARDGLGAGELDLKIIAKKTTIKKANLMDVLRVATVQVIPPQTNSYPNADINEI